ncbi:hypothetical protein GF373_13440 [bacterium]|nr:hypothetical protein [bacterium]
MNLDKKLKEQLLEQNGQNDKGATDKIQDYLINRWEKEEQKIAAMKRILMWIWGFVAACFIGYIVFLFNYEIIEDLVEQSPLEDAMQFIAFLFLILVQILPFFAIAYSILCLVRYYSHKQHFEKMADRANLNKQLARIEALLEQAIEEKRPDRPQND